MRSNRGLSRCFKQCYCLNWLSTQTFIERSKCKAELVIDLGFNIRHYQFSACFKTKTKTKRMSVKIASNTLPNIYAFSDKNEQRKKNDFTFYR